MVDKSLISSENNVYNKEMETFAIGFALAQCSYMYGDMYCDMYCIRKCTTL